MNEPSDESLVSAAANQDDAALQELYSRHTRALSAYLRSRFPTSQDDVEEIAQDTWIRILNGLREGRYEFTRPGQFRQFLFSVAKNTLVDRYRRKRVQNVTNADVASAVVESEGLTQLVANEEMERLQSLIEALPDNDRDLVRMRIAGLSYDEISERLNAPIKAVHHRWRRIREKLASQISSDAPSSPVQTPKREITVTVDPGDSPPELIADLYASIASLYRACGGSGLIIGRDERRTFVRELL